MPHICFSGRGDTSKFPSHDEIADRPIQAIFVFAATNDKTGANEQDATAGIA